MARKHFSNEMYKTVRIHCKVVSILLLLTKSWNFVVNTQIASVSYYCDNKSRDRWASCLLNKVHHLGGDKWPTTIVTSKTMLTKRNSCTEVFGNRSKSKHLNPLFTVVGGLCKMFYDLDPFIRVRRGNIYSSWRNETDWHAKLIAALQMQPCLRHIDFQC